MRLERRMEHTGRGCRATFPASCTNEPAVTPGGDTHLENMGVSIHFIEPMLLLKTGALPEGQEWLYELKFDGYRAVAYKTGGDIHLRSRNDNDFTLR